MNLDAIWTVARDSSNQELIKTGLLIWGASLSTILALIQVVKHFREKAVIRVNAYFVNRSVDADAEAKGTKVNTESGCKELLVVVRVANHGLRAMQITAVMIDNGKGRIIQIQADDLPAVLDPNTSVELTIQKEWLDQDDVRRFGVVDALGRTHLLGRQETNDLISHSRSLPTRVKPYRHRETGKEVKAFQALDRGIVIKMEKRPGKCRRLLEKLRQFRRQRRKTSVPGAESSEPSLS